MSGEEFVKFFSNKNIDINKLGLTNGEENDLSKRCVRVMSVNKKKVITAINSFCALAIARVNGFNELTNNNLSK